jgi:hypothetical protein
MTRAPVALAAAPIATLAGRYAKRTRCAPGVSATPRKRWFAGTIVAGVPSTVARQPG